MGIANVHFVSRSLGDYEDSCAYLPISQTLDLLIQIRLASASLARSLFIAGRSISHRVMPRSSRVYFVRYCTSVASSGSCVCAALHFARQLHQGGPTPRGLQLPAAHQ